MQNLDQIRAQSVWKAKNSGDSFAGKEGGSSVVKTLPPLIQNHGLLQTLAYACEKSNSGYRNVGERNTCNHIAKHLCDRGIVSECDSADDLLLNLLNGDSQLLKRATTETLAWLNFARRFL